MIFFFNLIDICESNLMATGFNTCQITKAIQNLPPELREIIYKHYLAIKLKEREVLGWNLVHNELLSCCLPKILITQIGHKIDFLQILYVNCTLSGYFKNTFHLGSKCFLQQFTRGVPWWTKMHILLVQKCQFSITLVTPHNS